MRAVFAVACVVAMGCGQTHGDEPVASSADALVGIWSRSDGRCEYAMLFDSHGRYDMLMSCDDGEGRSEAGGYVARDGMLEATPDDGCAVQDWEAPFTVTGGSLILGGLAFMLLDDEGPFSEPVTCD